MVDIMSRYFGEDPYNRTSAKKMIEQVRGEKLAENQTSRQNTSGLDSGEIESLQRRWNEFWGANSSGAASLDKPDDGHGGTLEQLRKKIDEKVCELANTGLKSIHDYAASSIPLNKPEGNPAIHKDRTGNDKYIGIVNQSRA